MQALRAGRQMHVPKPVEMAEIVTVVASLVGRKNYLTQLLVDLRILLIANSLNQV